MGPACRVIALAIALTFQTVSAQTPQAAPPAAEAPDAPPPAELFAVESELEDVWLSPSGRYVASVLRRDSDSFIVISDLEDAAARKATKIANTLIHTLEWIGDDRLIYSAGSSDIGIKIQSSRIVISGAPRFFSMNRDFTSLITLFENDKKINRDNLFFDVEATPIPGDTEHVLLPASVEGRMDLLKVNVRSGAWTQAGEGQRLTVGWLADRTGRPVMRLDVNSRGTELRVMTPQTQPNGKVRWKEAARWRRDRKTGKAPDFIPIGPGPAPNLYHVLGRPPGADRIGVHLYDVNAETYVEEVFVHPEVDVEAAFVDQATGKYSGAAFWKDQLEFAFADRSLQRHIDGLKVFFGNEASVSIIDRSEDGAVWLLAVSGPRDPGSYHIYDTRKTFSRQIGALNPELARHALGSMKPISYTARDGLAIHGYLTLPPGLAEGAKPPLIVYPHGGPEVRDVAGYHPVVQFLATRGYAVLQPNFRGSSGYGLAFAKSGRRQFGRAMQTDIDDGVAWLAEQGLVDPERICILGESYGGYAAMMGAALRPDLYRCAVSVMGISDLRSQILFDRKEEGSNSEAYKYWVAQLGEPGRDRAEMDAHSPIKLIGQIRAPILLLHGARDDNVPIEQSEKMEAALRAAGRDVRFVRFEEAGHGFYGEDLTTYLAELGRFFDAHLPVPAAAGAAQAAE